MMDNKKLCWGISRGTKITTDDHRILNELVNKFQTACPRLSLVETEYQLIRIFSWRRSFGDNDYVIYLNESYSLDTISSLGDGAGEIDPIKHGFAAVLFFAYLAKELENHPDYYRIKFSDQLGQEIELSTWEAVQNYLEPFDFPKDDVAFTAEELNIAQRVFHFSSLVDTPTFYF